LAINTAHNKQQTDARKKKKFPFHKTM